MRSMEADLLPLDDPLEEKADLIDGVLGAGSMFDDTHGVHADGVSITTPDVELWGAQPLADRARVFGRSCMNAWQIMRGG